MMRQGRRNTFELMIEGYHGRIGLKIANSGNEASE